MSVPKMPLALSVIFVAKSVKSSWVQLSVGSLTPFACIMSLLYMMTLTLPGFHSDGRPYIFPSNMPP